MWSRGNFCKDEKNGFSKLGFKNDNMKFRSEMYYPILSITFPEYGLQTELSETCVERCITSSNSTYLSLFTRLGLLYLVSRISSVVFVVFGENTKTRVEEIKRAIFF